jgi:putative transcriptional regulator
LFILVKHRIFGNDSLKDKMQLDYDFFKINKRLSPKRGRIIISEPFLPGNYFSRSTILLVEHSDKGAIGFILNKPVETAVKDLFKDFPDFGAEVYVGGPVGNESIYYIHTLGDKLHGSIHVKDNLYWGGDFDHLKALIGAGLVELNQVRFFIGYSGWSEGQLEKEIIENSWLVTDAPVEAIMNSDEDFWIDSVKNAGGHYELWQNFPEDPTLN